MRNKIYFGDVDLIDTRTGKVKTVQRVMYKENQPLNEIRGRALQSIAGHDRQYYQIVQPDPARAKVIGETVHP